MDSSRQSALAATAVSLAYRSTTVVTDASVHLAGGEVVALVGPNGSGKSTLLRALARLHRPEAGRIAVDGVPVDGLASRDLARVVTLLAQSRPVPGGISVRDLVEHGRHPHRGRWGGRDAAGPEAVARAMSMTGIADLADRSVDELSGGQRQRVWLALCLAQDTDILLLDEPTNHLDLRHQVETLDLVRDLACDHGVAIGIVLHDLNQAAAVADRVVLLHEGRVHAAGTPTEVFTAEHLTAVYGIPVAVATDPVTNQLSTRPLGRHTKERVPT